MKEVNFPIEGGSSGFTYSFKDCTGSPTTEFVFDDPSVSSWLSLTNASGLLTISAATAPASLINPRTAKVNIKVNSRTCSEYFSVTQSGNVCSCSTAMATGASTVAIPQTGGSNIEIGTYTADTNCITVSGTGSSNQTWLTNVTVSGGKVYGTLTANYNASRQATVTIGGTMKNDSSTCTKTLTVTQPGLSCDCTTAFVVAAGSVTQAGSGGASAEIGTYTSDATCIQTVSGTGTSSESWITNVTVSGGKINGIVATNTGIASRTTTITVKATMKNGTECPKTFTLTQPGITCNCNTAFTATAGSVVQAGSAGASVQIGTYTSDATCIQTVSGSGASSESWITTITLSGGKVNGIVAENTGAASRSTTITVKATMKDNTECTKTFMLTQPGLSCDCTTAFTVTAGSVAQGGSAGASVQIGTYTSDATCVQSVSGTGASSESWITNVTVSGGKINGIVAANTGTASRTTTITTKATLKNGTECPKTFTLTQQGVSCSCGSIIIDEVEPIPQSGLTGGATVGKYKCGSNNCNWCDNWECIITDGASTYNCTVTVNNTTSFTISLASGVVIPANNDQQGNAKTMSLAIKNGGSTCLTDTLTQNGLANCTCEGLIDQTGSMVRTVETAYGTSGGDGIFASGDTKGCGKLSGFTVSTDFIQQGTFAQINPYINNDPNTYAWSGTVTSYSGTRTADINYKYQDRRGNWLDCTEYVQLVQGDGVCACPITSGTIPASITLDGDGETTSSFRITGNMSIGRTEESYPYNKYFCQAVIGVNTLESGTVGWLGTSSKYTAPNPAHHIDTGYTTISIKPQINKTGAPRTTTYRVITLSNPNSYMRITDGNYGSINSSWNGNHYRYEIEDYWSYNSCNEYTIELIQPTRTPCTCKRTEIEDYNGNVITNYYSEVSGGSETHYVYLRCGRIVSVLCKEHDDHTQTAPSSEIQANFVQSTHVNVKYDSEGYFEIWMSENTTGEYRYYDLEVEIELEDGTTCTRYITVGQRECDCEDDFYEAVYQKYADSNYNIRITVPSGDYYPPSSHTYFEVGCLTEGHTLTYQISGNPCSWIQEVRVDNVPGNPKKFDIVVVASENGSVQSRSCGGNVGSYQFGIVPYLDGQPCTSSNIRLYVTQEGTPQDCDECDERLEKFTTTSATFAYDYHSNGSWNYYIYKDGVRYNMKNTFDIQSGTSCIENYVWSNYQLTLTGTNADKFFVQWNPTSYTIAVSCLEDNTTQSDWTATIEVKGCRWDDPTRCVDWERYPSIHVRDVCRKSLSIQQKHNYTPPTPTETYPCDSEEGRCNCVRSQGKYMPSFGNNTSNNIVMNNGSLLNGKWEMTLAPNLTDTIIGTIPMDYFECLTNYCVDENDNPDCSCLGYRVNNASETKLMLWIDSSGNIHAKTGNVAAGETYSATIAYWFIGADDSTSVQCTLGSEARIINVTF